MMKMRRGDVMKIERARDRDLGDLGRLLPVTPDRHHRPTDELEGHLSKIEIAISEISGDCYPLLRDRHHRPTNISPDRAPPRATSRHCSPLQLDAARFGGSKCSRDRENRCGGWWFLVRSSTM